MDNKWSQPEGYPNGGFPKIEYQIRTPNFFGAKWDSEREGFVVPLGGIETHTTQLFLNGSPRGHNGYYHELNLKDQWFADHIVDLIQRVCAYFYAKDNYVPMKGVFGIIISDKDVRERIRRIDLGENSREAIRVGEERYPLQELPFDQQRALIEHIEEFKLQVGFKIIGEVDNAAARYHENPGMGYDPIPEEIAWG